VSKFKLKDGAHIGTIGQ